MKTKDSVILILASLVQILVARAQPLQPEVLYQFQLGPRHPDCRLVEVGDGSLIGTTSGGGRYDEGTFFKVSTNGLLATFFCFDGTNGAAPRGPLIWLTTGIFTARPLVEALTEKD